MAEPGAPDALLDRLGRSSFRSRFRLRGRELEYLRRRGLDVVLQHAARFVEERLAPALPDNDGRQTPFRNHPVFVAQHATATCCRGCLEKWHGIPRGSPLSDSEKRRVLSVVERWLRREEASAGAGAARPPVAPAPEAAGRLRVAPDHRESTGVQDD